MLHRHMVETPFLQKVAIKHGNLKEKDTLLLGPDWHRVCAPTTGELAKTFPIIFWDQSDANSQPSWDKVVK